MAPRARASGPFPDLALASLDGGVHRLSEAWSRGEALVLLGHGDCPTTRLALPFLERIHRRHTRGAVLLVLQDAAAAARKLQAALGLTVPIRLEPDPYPLVADLHVSAVPTLVLVGRDGNIAQVSEGFDRSALQELAARLGVAGPLLTPEDRAPAFKPG